MMRNIDIIGMRLAMVCVLLLPPAVSKVAAAPELAVVSKWGRFEQSFRSGVLYTNPLQEASLKVAFTSPLGDKFEVEGFWDGGRTWRVRFSPDQPGRWKFTTTCSDDSNGGLHNQSGEFLCSSATGITRFHKHGQARVARDRRHLELLDGTPFFWLADTVWKGARVSDLKDWGFYAGVRASQRFTVAQLSVAPGEDVKGQSALTGFPNLIGINPEFFQRMDEKIEVLGQAGILAAIAPLLELPSQKNIAPPLPDDQAELLVRYVVARWGAEPVAWLLAFEGDTASGNVGRWKRIGRAVFGTRAHAPVILFPGETQWVLDEFRDEKWVDVFGYQSVTDFTEDALKWTFTGPFKSEWRKDPARPLIPFVPYENGVPAASIRHFTPDEIRHAIYWSLLLTPPAGVSYGAQGVVDWDRSFGPGSADTKYQDMEMWRKGLFMPAAKQMEHLAELMNSADFWKLRPLPDALAAQPGDESPQRYIVAATTEDKTLSLIYAPGNKNVEVYTDALPKSPAVAWLNPRTGDRKVAVAVVVGRSCQLPTPDSGDWLLVTRAGK